MAASTNNAHLRLNRHLLCRSFGIALCLMTFTGIAHAEPATGDLQIEVNVNATTGGDAVRSEAVNSQVEASPTTGDGAAVGTGDDGESGGYLDDSEAAGGYLGAAGAPVSPSHAPEAPASPGYVPTPAPVAAQLECELCAQNHDHSAPPELTRRQRRQARGTRWVLGLGARAESVGDEVYGGATFYVRRGGDRGFYVFGTVSGVGGYNGDFDFSVDDNGVQREADDINARVTLAAGPGFALQLGRPFRVGAEASIGQVVDYDSHYATDGSWTADIRGGLSLGVRAFGEFWFSRHFGLAGTLGASWALFGNGDGIDFDDLESDADWNSTLEIRARF